MNNYIILYVVNTTTSKLNYMKKKTTLININEKQIIIQILILVVVKTITTPCCILENMFKGWVNSQMTCHGRHNYESFSCYCMSISFTVHVSSFNMSLKVTMSRDVL